MDLLAQGKLHAQKGAFDEALDAFVLALENDKENPDIHYYLGLCYSSLENFGYAKYHYDMALTLNPTHGKTRLVYAGLKEVEAEKPPERRITRQAAAKIRRSQTSESVESEETPSVRDFTSSPVATYDLSADPVDESPSALRSESEAQREEDKWASAFPAEQLMKPQKGSFFAKFFLMVLAIAIVAAIVFWGLSLYP